MPRSEEVVSDDSISGVLIGAHVGDKAVENQWRYTCDRVSSSTSTQDLLADLWGVCGTKLKFCSFLLRSAAHVNQLSVEPIRPSFLKKSKNFHGLTPTSPIPASFHPMLLQTSLRASRSVILVRYSLSFFNSIGHWLIVAEKCLVVIPHQNHRSEILDRKGDRMQPIE
jgi:hypothetical protein